MTNIEASLSPAGSSGSERRPEFALGGLIPAIKAHQLYRATLRRLRALSDKQLTDIGFRRDDLKAVARGATFQH